MQSYILDFLGLDSISGFHMVSSVVRAMPRFRLRKGKLLYWEMASMCVRVYFFLGKGNCKTFEDEKKMNKSHKFWLLETFLQNNVNRFPSSWPTEGNFQNNKNLLEILGFDIVKFYFYLETQINSANFLFSYICKKKLVYQFREGLTETCNFYLSCVFTEKMTDVQILDK